MRKLPVLQSPLLLLPGLRNPEQEESQRLLQGGCWGKMLRHLKRMQPTVVWWCCLDVIALRSPEVSPGKHVLGNTLRKDPVQS